jgi:hypothetical protein
MNSTHYQMDRIYLFSIQVLTLIAVLSNIICACVFSRLKATIFKYLAINSVVDCILVSSLVLVPFIKSSLYPSIDGAYWMNVYRIGGLAYFFRSLGFLSSFISIKISIDRLRFVKSKYTANLGSNTSKLQMAKVLGPLFVIAFGANIPKMMFASIVEVNKNGSSSCNCTEYKSILSTGSNLAIVNQTLVVNGINVFIVCALIVLNTLLVINICKKFNDAASKNRNQQIELANLNTIGVIEQIDRNKRATATIASIRQIETRQERMKRDTAQLVVWSALLNLVDQLALVSINLFLVLDRGKSIYSNRSLIFAVHLLLLLSHSANIFIYSLFNKQFAKGLRNLFSLSQN